MYIPKQIGIGQRNKKHGHTWMDENGKVYTSPTWGSWRAMRRRAGRRPGYENVTVCDRWSQFTVFLADMGPRPDGKTLDRIDNTENYEPSNCRWSTPSEQAYNRRPKGYRNGK